MLLSQQTIGMSSGPRSQAGGLHGRHRRMQRNKVLLRHHHQRRSYPYPCHAFRPRGESESSCSDNSKTIRNFPSLHRLGFADGVAKLLGRQVPCWLLVALLQLNQVDSALAILKGNPNAKIPRTPEAALRRSTPVVNAQMTDIQSKLEEVAYLLRIPQRKQWDKMQADIEACRDAIANQRPEIFRDVSESKEELVKETLEDVDTALQQMLRGITYKDSGYCGKYLNSALNSVSLIELSQVRSLPYSVPRSLANYPVLTGRAQVKFTIRSGSADRMFLFQDQELSQDPVGSFTVDLDGFTSPITSGQFLANVRNGLYSGTKVNEDYNQSSLITNVTSDPVTPPVAENDESSSKGYSNLPLEIFQTGEFEPSYNTTLDVLNMEYPVLPMSIYGAVVMCHDDTNGDSYKSSKDNFFIYKFDKSMGGLSGLSFEEGQFTVVGYVTAGSDLVQQIKSGDVIEKVEILSGEERLKEPFPPPRRALVVNDDVTTTTEEPEEGQQPVPNQPLVGENEQESA